LPACSLSEIQIDRFSLNLPPRVGQPPSRHWLRNKKTAGS
jgi:hypothetical protein